MTDFNEIIAAIADDIDDTTGEYTEQTKRAIQAAQRYCERNEFYFNETRDQTFATVNGQAWYGAADNANIPTLVRIQHAYTEDGSGQRLSMVRAMPEEIEILSDNSSSTGKPSLWAYFGQRIRLYPIPDATVYTIRLQIGPYRLGPLVDLSDTNAWLSEGYDMLKARAKYILAKDTLKDPDVALEALNDYNEQFWALKAETSKRSRTGYIRPTKF